MSMRHPMPELRLFKNLTLKTKGQGHGWGNRSSHNVGLTSYRFTSLSFHVNRPSHSWDTAFSKFDLENQGSRSTSLDNSIDRSIQGFQRMGSAKSGPSAAWFDKFLAHGQAHMGQMGKWLWQFTTTGPDKRERERLSLSAFLRTEDIGVHIVHISRLIITYTLE